MRFPLLIPPVPGYLSYTPNLTLSFAPLAGSQDH